MMPMPSNAQTSPELAAPTSQNSPANLPRVDWLIKSGVAANPQHALELANQAAQNPRAVYANIYKHNIRTNGGDRVKAEADTRNAIIMLNELVPSLGQTPAAAPGAPQLGALSPATALGETPQLQPNVSPSSMYSPSPGMWRGAPPSPALDNPQPIFPAAPVPAAPVTRLQNVSALSGSVPSIPPQQKTVYPTPPYYSGPGDEQFLRPQPLPPDRNTYQPQDIMQNSLRIRQEDI
jgi:hypothetical protein